MSTKLKVLEFESLKKLTEIINIKLYKFIKLATTSLNNIYLMYYFYVKYKIFVDVDDLSLVSLVIGS